VKHLLQDLSSGETAIVEAPDPLVAENSILVRTSLSLISAGTERMLVEFGKASLLDKARQQPEKVKMVLEKVQTDGLLPTIEAVRSKLDQPISLGYSSVGVVAKIGTDVDGFEIGDRVVSNGPHSSLVKTTANLSARIPDNVDDASAAFTVVSSIALQGVRLSAPTLGESFVVIGAGLIGLLTVQLLKAHGCRVLAVDLDDEKLVLAKQFGAEICNPMAGGDPVAAGMAFSRSIGVDGVIITASTKSNDPVTQAARMSRKRGRIVLVGVTGLDLNRADFYEKELTFQVSCSYGPGRYDSEYEEKGKDYPIGFVRWTEQRNFEAVLDLMSTGKLDIGPLVSHRFNFEDAAKAYEKLSADKTALGILLEYPADTQNQDVSSIELQSGNSANPSKVILGCIGAGNYAARTLIPAFRQSNARLHTLVSAGGVSGAVEGEKAGFEVASTDATTALGNNEVNSIAIATRHDTHADVVVDSLDAGKHVFVEKPLCLNLEDLDRVEKAYAKSNQLLMVGFNRRFAPHVVKIKQLLKNSSDPHSFVMTVNAGAIPSDHWTQDREQGGGRLIGEACHFVDLLKFLADSAISEFDLVEMASEDNDTLTVSLKFENGSIGAVHYFANGNKAYPKERLEIFSGGKILQLDNFRKLKGYGWAGFKSMNLFRQDKGQSACVEAFVQAIEEGKTSPIPFEEIAEVSRVCIKLVNSNDH
jgi:predicted dehydrogenase/threonine dehydrogenase-like Zn-dependent dehydrogenase